MKSKFALPVMLVLAAASAGAESTATESAAPATPAADQKPAREKMNGVTRPSPGTATGNVWAIADRISSEKGRPALRAEVTAAGAEAGINPSTVTTQFGQWRRFYGLKKEERQPGQAAPETEKQKAKREAKEAKAAAKAAKAATPSTVPDGGVAVVTTEGGDVVPVPDASAAAVEG
jgi:hypothetical protein